MNAKDTHVILYCFTALEISLDSVVFVRFHVTLFQCIYISSMGFADIRFREASAVFHGLVYCIRNMIRIMI